MSSLPSKCRIAVPPGVGDVYWVLTKMADFRRKNQLKHVTFCVKRNQLTRALDWPNMTEGLVDSAVEFEFEVRRNPEIITSGFSRTVPGVDCVLWPNSIIDRGIHLRNWIPKYEIDLNFPIKTAPILDGRDHEILVYASSAIVNNSWFPGRGSVFWSGLISHLAERTGKPVTLIGAGWDAEFAGQIKAPYLSLIGRTTLPQIADVIKNAKLLIGIISGMTILGNHFGTPTVAIWPEHRFPAAFPISWVRSNLLYSPVRTGNVNVKQITETGLSLAGLI